MDNLSFENYKVEDLITDQSFINFHFNVDPGDIKFWENWLSHHPSRLSEVLEAREIIDSLSLTLTKNEYDQEYLRIKNAIEEEKNSDSVQFSNWISKPKRLESRKKLVVYIAAIFILISSSLFYLNTKPKNDHIIVANQIVHSGNASRSLTLSDGTVVTLAPNSSIQYPTTFEGKNRQVFLNGDAAFNVKRNESFPFKVHSKNLVATVLGTVFKVKKTDSAIMVQLFKGKVNVSIEDSSSSINPLMLYPEEEAVYILHNRQFYKRDLIDLHAITFRKNEFTEVADKMKLVFNKTLINKSFKKNWRFTGQFSNASASQIIDNICEIENLTSTIKGDTIYINNKESK